MSAPAVFPDRRIIVVSHEEIDGHAQLYPEEAAAVARAIEKRRAEFAAGRACAREALRRLGIETGAIPPRDDRAPVWPDGVVGSITHCPGFVAAAVALRSDFAGLGFDAEGAEPLDSGLVRLICTTDEQRSLRDLPPPPHSNWPKIVFSAKEAVHKAIAPDARITLGFTEVEIDFDPDAGSFTARLVGRQDPRLPPFARLDGRFAATDRHVFAGVVLRS